MIVAIWKAWRRARYDWRFKLIYKASVEDLDGQVSVHILKDRSCQTAKVWVEDAWGALDKGHGGARVCDRALQPCCRAFQRFP